MLRGEQSQPIVPVIVGPTAAGKSALALRLAQRCGGEIVSADSRQVYRYLDIGTAKPTPEERTLVPHHLIDVRFPDEYYSAGEYARDASARIAEVLGRGHLPIVVGGSGFYIRALTDGLFGPNIRDPELRERLRQEARKDGLGPLWRRLCEVDPQAAERLHPNDAQRIIRALEVYECTGIPLSEHQRRHRPETPFSWCFIGLRWARAELYARIDRRVDQMMTQGFEEEVRRLEQMGYGPELNSLQTVGYKEMFALLHGELQRDEAVALIKQHTRNYAKRQLTWFGRDARVQWIDMTTGTMADCEEKAWAIVTRCAEKGNFPLDI